MSVFQSDHLLFMTVSCGFFALLLLEDSQFLQPLPGEGRLIKLAFSLAVLTVGVQDLQEVFREEL